MIEAKNREQRLKMRTLKIHGESDFTETASKPDEPEDSKEPSDSLKNTLIMQCEQEYENMINAVRKFSANEQLTLDAQIFKC